MQRCSWLNLDNPQYVAYHDQEWGVPVHNDNKLFEMLILEGAQAGLSWETILKRRDHYRTIFKNFEPTKVARLQDAQLEKILLDPRIIRNRLKVYSTRTNAKVFIAIQKEYGSFDKYLWAFSDAKALSKDLKRRGMSFVGPTIIYAFMQAIGMVNDHSSDCFKSK